MDLHVELDRARRGLADRLTDQLRVAVRTGRLSAGTRLPSSRVLAGDLQISRGVVVEAYARLEAEGLLDARAGAGTRVARYAQADWPATNAQAAAQHPQARCRPGPGHQGGIRFDLRAGTPDLGRFPRARWLAASRAALASVPDSDLSYPDPAGHAALRAELADYLGRVRAAVADPRHMVVTSGVAQALALTGRILAAAGHGTLAVEDPCSPRVVPLLAATGLRLAAVPVDSDGLDVDALARTTARVVLVTPAHQYPTGVVLSPHRRAALAAWARERDGLVIEDDYDAEFRYDRDPVSCVQGLAPGHVALAGTVSKTLVPGLRLGWVLAPPWLATELARSRMLADLGAPLPTQATLAEFLASGGYDRHLRAMRRLYRGRRDAFAAALRDQCPELRLHGISAGLHLYAQLPPGSLEAAVIAAAATHGVAVEGASTMRPAPASRPVRPALVLGYAALPEGALQEAAGRLAAALADVMEPPSSPARAGQLHAPEDPTATS